MELLDALNDRINLIFRRQESDAEVEGTFTLTKARTRNHTDTCSFKKVKTIEGIRRNISSFCSFDSLLRKGDAGEEVHSTRRLGASESFKRIDGSAELEGTALERLNDVILLLLVEFVRSISRLGRIDHAVHNDLAHGVGAKSDGNHLVKHGVDFREEVIELDVATTMTALAEEALGDRVEAGNLDALPDVVTHIMSNLTEADELCTILIHILLVHLISKEDNAVLDAETNNLLHAFNAEDLASWVVGVDDNKAAAFDALGSSLLIAAFKFSRGERPALLLVKRITDLDTIVEAEKRGVKWVLRSGSHDTNMILLADKKVQHVTNSTRGTISAVNGVRVTRNTITSSDEVSDILTNERMALAEHISTSKEASIEKTLGTSNSIGSESLRCLLNEFRILHKRAHLSDESQRFLLKLLWVTNITISNIIKRKTRRNTLLLCLSKLFF